MIIAAIGLSIGYILVLLFYYSGWKKTSDFKVHKCIQRKVCVIIPARNEAENIGHCLSSILKNNYPSDLTEVIVVNDHSTDNTAAIAESFKQVQVLHLADFKEETKGLKAFKKFGIEKAISQTKADIVLQTDADCIVPESWIQTFVSFLVEQDLKAATSIVHFEKGENSLQRFQALDLQGMMFVTAAGFHYKVAEMANGANMAYLRQAFLEINGFSGSKQFASGDDVFLIQKMSKRWPGKVAFLKSSAQGVYTKSPSEWSGFWQQRIRWATKNGSYEKLFIPLILAYVFGYTNLIFGFLMLSLFNKAFFFCGLILFFTKFTGDFFFLKATTKYFKRSGLLKNYPLSQLYHLIYIFWVGWRSLFNRKYEWKGRNVT